MIDRVSIPREDQTLFFGNNLISIDQITSPALIHQLFEMAEQMKAVKHGNYQPLLNMRIAALFYEASTRTSISFQSAAQNLGASVTMRDGMGKFSSVIKGESLEDTIHAVCNGSGSELIVLRHHRDNSAERAAAVANGYRIPVINAGSGTKEHPTQALLDLYTIKNRLGRTDHLRVMMVGDLKNGRTNKSLAKLLALMDPNVELIFISPEQLRLPQDFIDQIKPRVAKIVESDRFETYLKDIDAIYMTRVQKERFAPDEQDLYDAVKDQYIFALKHAQMMKPDGIIMHPLPRVNEISYEVDQDPRAAYFEQMYSGLITRMALLHEILAGHKLIK